MVAAGEPLHLRIPLQYDPFTGWTYEDRCGEEYLAARQASARERALRAAEVQRSIEEHNAALRDRLNIDRGFLGTMWDGTGGLVVRGIRAAACPSEVELVAQELGIGGLGRGAGHLLNGELQRALNESVRAVAINEIGNQLAPVGGPAVVTVWVVGGAGATAVDAACELVGIVR